MSGRQVRLAGVTPYGERIILRPFRLRDQSAYLEARRVDSAWLTPWDPTNPDGVVPRMTYREMVRKQRAAARAKQSLAFIVEAHGQIVGQINSNSILWGAARSFSAGYWVSSRMAGRWIAPTAVALLADYCLGVLALHRMELAIRPENTASLAVAEKLRMREEGLRPNFLHIDGAWRDHRIFALTTEDLHDGRGATVDERMRRSFEERSGLF